MPNNIIEKCLWWIITLIRKEIAPKEVMEQFPYPIVAIKTDNHSTFTNIYTGMNKRSDMTVKTIHPLDRFCAERGIIHCLIGRGKYAQNSTVERSHRQNQESSISAIRSAVR